MALCGVPGQSPAPCHLARTASIGAQRLCHLKPRAQFGYWAPRHPDPNPPSSTGHPGPTDDKQPVKTQGAQGGTDSEYTRSAQRQMEDELRDPSNFLEFLAPRPLRLVLLWAGAASCAVAVLLGALQLAEDPSVVQTLVINACGLVLFSCLALADAKAGEGRVEARRRVREAQIRAGDREVFVNDKGERMSRLKEVDVAWVLRRLESWGRRDNMPFLGPKKGALLAQLVRDRAPALAVEVGTMAGYSALTIAQHLPRGARLISYEKDLTWWLTAQRMMWQVSVRWGDATAALNAWRDEPPQSIQLLFLDGVPRDTLAYLRAAEPHLAPGALVIADNAGVFSQGGMRDYLEHVRTSPLYRSRYIESTLEWRDDVPDGLEVSEWLGPDSSSRQGTSSGVADKALAS